jgi:hypothetical protein
MLHIADVLCSMKCGSRDVALAITGITLCYMAALLRCFRWWLLLWFAGGGLYAGPVLHHVIIKQEAQRSLEDNVVC